MKFHWILFLLLFVTACSSPEEKAKSEVETEEFPKVDMKRFEKKAVGGVEMLLLKELTSSALVSNITLIDHNHFALEKHVRLKRDQSKKGYDQFMSKGRGIAKKNIFKTYAQESFDKFKGVFKESSKAELILCEVNGMKCYRAQFEASSHGFPKRKSYWIRYFEGKDGYYSLVCWTVEESKSKFAKEALAMGLSFKTN